MGLLEIGYVFPEVVKLPSQEFYGPSEIFPTSLLLCEGVQDPCSFPSGLCEEELGIVLPREKSAWECKEEEAEHYSIV